MSHPIRASNLCDLLETAENCGPLRNDLILDLFPIRDAATTNLAGTRAVHGRGIPTLHRQIVSSVLPVTKLSLTQDPNQGHKTLRGFHGIFVSKMTCSL